MPSKGKTVDAPVRRCGKCGCTDDRACPGGCSWIGPNLCSACRGPSPWQRIIRAADRGTGLRLSAEEARRLASDKAIRTRSECDDGIDAGGDGDLW